MFLLTPVGATRTRLAGRIHVQRGAGVPRVDRSGLDWAVGARVGMSGGWKVGWREWKSWCWWVVRPAYLGDAFKGEGGGVKLAEALASRADAVRRVEQLRAADGPVAVACTVPRWEPL
jgi:hypothetical protein